jgi:orotate phosphoribosyltransferase
MSKMLAVETTPYCVNRTLSTPDIDVKPHSQRSQLLRILLEKSVRRGRFELSSGATSDLYVDAKQTTSDPKAAILVGQLGWELVKENAATRGIHIDSIGGLTMGADWMALSIAIAAQLESARNNIKAFSVRKSAKKHGLHKLIEGNFASGQSVVVVDDVITTGGSTLQAIKAIEASGGHVAFVLVLVDRQEGGRAAIEERGHAVVSVFRQSDLSAIDAERPAHLLTA